MSEGRVRPLFDAMAEDVTWRWMGVKQWTRSFNGKQTVTAEELAALQTDVLAGFVLARAATGLSDGTIASDVVMRPAGVPCRLSPGRAARRGWTEGSHRRARSTQPGGY